MTVFSTTPGRTANPPFMTRGAAASKLGISPAGVDKLTAAGMMRPSLKRTSVATMAQRPELVVSDGAITVLRTTATTPSQSHARGSKGYDYKMDADEISDANLGWWRVDTGRVIDNKIFVVTISTFVAAVFSITGIAASEGAGTERRHMLEGTLLGSTYHGVRGFGYKTRDYNMVETILGSRIYTESGGPIAYLGDR